MALGAYGNGGLRFKGFWDLSGFCCSEAARALAKLGRPISQLPL